MGLLINNSSSIVDSNGNEAFINSDGQLHVVLMGKVDPSNSTAVPLIADAVYTGTAIDTLDFGFIFVTVFADQDSATDGISFQQSSDATNWDNTDEFSYFANSGKTYSIQPAARYFRVLFTNGSTTQTTFRFQTIFKKTSSLASSHRISENLSPEDDASLQIAIIKGQNPSGNYVDFSATAGGNFKVSLEELESGISVNSNSQLKVTQYDASGNETTRPFDESHYLSEYLLNAASRDMVVNGAITPVDFIYTVPVGKKVHLARSFIVLEDGASVFGAGDFGAISGALGNGVQIAITPSGGSEVVLENWTTNREIRATMFDFDTSFGANPPVGSYIGRWTFGKDLANSGISLAAGDVITARVRDDLTDLSEFQFKIKGRIETA